jgi:hypothetical protein
MRTKNCVIFCKKQKRSFFFQFRGSLVGTQEQRSKFNNFGSRKAFLIILFVAFRGFFVAPGVKFLKLFF